MMDEGGKIVELWDGKEWSRTTLRDVKFMINVIQNLKYREIEGSLDGGVIWKTIYDCELELLSIEVCQSIKWRVKGD